MKKRINIYTLKNNEAGICMLSREHGFLYEETAFNVPSSIASLLNHYKDLKNMAEEYLFLLCLNPKGRLLGLFELSHGGQTYSVVSPKSIFQRALLCGANYIVLCHNHPSGDCTPSSQDIKVAKDISKLGKDLEIPLMDSIIIGKENGYFSFHEKGIL